MLDARPASDFPGTELIDCIELPILIIDRDLTVASFNTAAARLLSLSDADYGRHLHSIQKPVGTQQMEELCEHVITTGSSHRVEMADGAGSRFSVNIGCHKANQNINGAVLTFTNVTAFRESLERAIEEREFTKVVLNTIADALLIVDSDLRIQAANQAFYVLFQTSRQESQGAHLYQMGNGGWDIPQLRALLNGSASPPADSQSLECDREFPGVGRRTLWLNARPLIQGIHSGLTTLITIQDVTERKRAMEALRESEERLRLAQQVGTIGSFEWNIQTNTNRWTPQLEAIYGLRPGDFSGTQEAWEQLLHPEDRAAAIRQVEKAFQTDAPVQAEFRVIWPDGSARWILGRWQVFRNRSGQPIRMTGVNIDITSRKEAEQIQRRFAAIVESSDDAIVGKNLNGIVTTWNPAAERMFGYSEKEMVGRSITTIIPAELHDDERKILETIERGERLERRQTVRVTRNGEKMDVSLTVSPVRDETGRVIGAASIARDITQEKKTEQALRITERLASVGRMAATVAHEINNPLEAVTNLVYLAKGCAVGEDVQKYLNTIDEELDRVSHLTRQTLGFYREAKAPSAVRVGPMVDSLVSFFGTRARNKGIEILPEIRRDPEIFAVAGEIRQVITNLLSNSIDAVGSGGLIRIRIDATCLRGNQSPGVRITVADSGPGIPPSVRSKLFEPFFTTKTDVGTGLGLWVCANVVKRHHGAIRVKSRTILGKSWTVFCVVLPSRQDSENNPLKPEV